MLRATLILTLLPAVTIAQQGEEPPGESPSTLVETYRDWVVRCDMAAAEERRCEMAQELRQADRRLVFAALFQAADEGDARGVFIAPFGLALSEGLRLEVAGQAPRTVAITTCYASGCVAEARFDEAALDPLLEGETATVAMTPLNGEQFDVTLSLVGFRGAWRRLQSLAE